MASTLDLLQHGSGRVAQAKPLGILFAEDFDTHAPPTAPEGAGAPPAPPPLTQEDMQRACAAAVAAARQQWEAEAAQRHGEAMATVAAALVDARDEAGRIAAEAASGVAASLLAMLAAALPQLCRDYGPAEMRAVVQSLLPALRSEPRITIRVHSELVSVVQCDVAALQSELAGTVSVLAAPIPSGDVKVTWNGGACVRDTGKILSAMDDVLNQLGLNEPAETLPERRMALA